MSNPLLPRLQLLAAALLFSTGGMAVKSCQLTGWQVASFRCGVAAAVVWALLPAARRRWTLAAMAAGCAQAATFLLYVLATKATTAAEAIFLQSTAPLYLLLLGPLLLGERVRGRDLAVMAGLGLGLALLLASGTDASATAPAPLRGKILGAGAGLTWALTLLALRFLGRRDGRLGKGAGGAPLAVLIGTLTGFLVPLPWALPVVESRPADWLWVLFLGVFQVAFPYFLVASAVRSVPAFEVSLLLLAEPVFNPVWAYWAHGERPAPAALLGGGLILAVTLVKTWLDVRDARRRPDARDRPPA